MKKALALAGILAMSATIALAVTAPTNTAGTGTFGTGYMKANESGDLAYTATNVGAGVTFTARLSANVYMSLQSNSTDGSTYLVSTIHGSGNKYYATGSGDSRIFMQESTSDTLITPPTVASSSAAVDWTGWTAVK